MKTIILFCSSLLLVASITSPARGATYNIADGDVTALIAAINAANASAGPDTINLAQGATFTLTQVADTDGFWGPDRKSTRLNSSHTEIYTLPLHDALPISINAANASAGPDTINLAQGATFTLTQVADTDGFWG